MNLTIDKDNYNGKTLLVVEGSVDEADLKALAAEVSRLLPGEEKCILLDCVDLKKVIYSSIGFSGLVNYLLECRAMNTRIILFGYDKLTFRLLKLLKVAEMFHYSNTLDEAYLALSKSYRQAILSGS